ncbi:MAG: site-specific DNA-methyltransferase [Phascolarctobacterium sp.]|nr:site-specific DNA-methyltransferase [Phascolarctobacterium sp.]
MPTLEWIGKEKVINHDKEVPFRILEPQYTYDSEGKHEGVATSDNMIIHGDNLLALKALLPKYRGKIKCIYIDPPYNTGNEGWIYNDNVNDQQIKKWLGEVVGKEGDDLSRHDKWLCMMYPRLRLLHELLAEDGAIFISIDDNEQANLKLICDEIFGQNNFIIQVAWQKRTSPDARKIISSGHEYIVVYCKDISNRDYIFHKLELDDEDKRKYKNPDNDIRGPWVSTDCTAQAGHGTESQFYTLTTPSGRVIELPKNLCWRYTQERMNEQIAEGRIWFGADGKGVPRKKTYLSERDGKNLWSWWTNKEVGHTQEATKEISQIMGNNGVFDYPKPLRLIHRIVQIATNKDSLILDSFAGSGTTAHAVLNINKQDGGNRKFVLVELGDYAEKVTAERVRRVIDGYGEGKNAVDGIGSSFTFYELGPQLFDENGNLNEEVGTDRIREYIWFTETQKPLATNDGDNKAFLGIANSCAYYFHYDKDATTTLDHEFIATIETKADSYVIYADVCSLDDDFLSKHHITFKKIPRDIARI